MEYYFVVGDTIVIPQACQVVFYVDGEVMYPDLDAVATIPKGYNPCVRCGRRVCECEF